MTLNGLIKILMVLCLGATVTVVQKVYFGKKVADHILTYSPVESKHLPELKTEKKSKSKIVSKKSKSKATDITESNESSSDGKIHVAEKEKASVEANNSYVTSVEQKEKTPFKNNNAFTREMIAEQRAAVEAEALAAIEQATANGGENSASTSSTGTTAAGSSVRAPATEAASQAGTGTKSSSTESTSSGGASSPTLTGVVFPLKTMTLVKQNNKRLLPQIKNFIVDEAYAANCSAVASLYELDSVTSLPSASAKNSVVVKSDATFSFNPSTLNLDLNKPNRYLVKVTGCNGDYQRIVTDYYSNQDISIGTTLLAKVIEVPTAKKVIDVDHAQLQQITSYIDPNATSLESAYSKLTSVTSVPVLFSNVFGNDISTLTNSKPQVVSESISVIVNEKTNTTYSITADHWYSQYDIVQEWYLDTNFVITGTSYIYSPTANDQGIHVLKTRIGKNDGSNRVDTSLPYEEKTWNITVIDTYPSMAPSFALNVANPTPVISNSFDIDINTGAAKINCENFSTFAITESAITPPQSEFIYSCTTAGTQTQTVTLSDLSDGPKTLYLWTRDASNTISASPSTLAYRKDTSNPVSSLSNIVGTIQGGSPYTLNFSASDNNEISSILVKFSSDNGATYSTVATLPAGSTTYSWNVPSLETLSNFVKITAIDGAGKSVESATGKFVISTTTPAAPSYTLASPAITNNTTVTLTINSCLNTTHILLNSGTTPAANDAGWIACSTAAGHYSYTLAGPDGNKSFAVWAKDATEDISASSTVNILLDTLAPVGSLADLPASVKGTDSYGLTFSSSDTVGIQSTELFYTLDGTTFTSIATNPSSPYTWTIPTTDTTSAKLKFVVKDTAGNITTVTSSTFTIDSTPPALHSISLASSTPANTTAVTLTAASCVDTPYVLVNEGTAPAAASGSWQSCSTVAGAITYSIAATEGTHNLKVWFKDSVGNVTSTSSPASMIYDITPPTVTIGAVTAALKGGNTQSVTFTSSDTNGVQSTKLQYAADGSTFSDVVANPVSPYSWTVPSSNTSASKLRFIVTDNAGNTNSADSNAFSIDSTPPAAPTLALVSASLTNSLLNTFTASSCTDTPSLFFNEGAKPASNDAGWISCTTNAGALSYSIAGGEGLHTLKVWSKDAVGNVSLASTDFSVTYDITNPAQTLNNLAALLQGGATTNISYTQSDANGISSFKLQYASDGITFTDIISNAASPYSWTIPLQNTSTAKIKLITIDNAGNTSSATSAAFTIDSTPPAVTIGAVTAALRGGEIQSITFTSSDANGIQSTKLQYAADGVTFSDVVANPVSPYSWTVPSSNTAASKLKFVVVDNAGNSNSAVSNAFSIDSTPPAAPSLALVSPALTNLLSNTFTASSCADRPSLFFTEGAKPAFNDAGWVTCTITAGALSYSISGTEGAHTIKVWSKDAVGNVSATSTDFAITYDITNPAQSLNNLAALLKGGTTTNITFTQSDANGLSSSKLQYSSDGTTFTDVVANPVSPYSWTVPSHNTSTAKIKLITTDNAGNTASVVTTAFTIDSNPPSAPVANLSTPAISSSTTVAVTISDCLDRPNIMITESMIAPGSADAGWAACSTAAGAHSTVLVGPVLQGVHTIYVWAKDTAGNVSASTALSMSYDNVAPSVNLATTLSGSYKGGTILPLSFSATDASGVSGIKIEYAADGATFATVANLAAGVSSYNWTIPSDNTSTAKIRLSANDVATATNTASVLSGAFTIDSTAPAAPAIALASNTYSSSTSVTLTAANCTDRTHLFVNEGAMPASGDAGWQACTTAAGGITYTIAATQGTHALKVWAKDTVGNVSSATSINMIFDSIAPTISISTGNNVKGNQTVPVTFTVTEANSSAAQNFLVEYYDGTLWTNKNVAAQNGPLSNTTFSTTVVTPNAENTSLIIKVSFTDLAGNTTQSSVTFKTDLTPPVVDLLSVNGGSLSTTNNNVQIALNAHDNISKVTQFCLRYNNSVAPDANASCWKDVNAPSPGIAANATISFSGYFYQIGFAKGNYLIYAWVKDETGQISTNASSINVDTFNIAFDPGTPPSISKVQVSNSDAPANPVTAADLSSPSGSDIYIKWNASDLEGLAASPITIKYSTDDSNFYDLTGGGNLSNGVNGSCTVDAGYTGCAVLAAPTSSYFKIRVIAKDTLGTTVFFNSAPMNDNKFRILAGNTEHGLNGSARSAVFYVYGVASGGHYGYKNKLVVSDDGKFFYLDPVRGLLWIDPTTGILKTFITKTGTITGDGGIVSSATLASPLAIALDHSNQLLIWDSNRIRRVNLDTMIITTVVGGGAQTDPLTTVNAGDMNLGSFNASSGTFIPLPNGDIIFTAPAGTLHHRRYRAIDQKIELIETTGVGLTSYPADIWTDKSKLDLGVAYNTTTSALTFMAQGIYKSWVGDSYPLHSRIDLTSGNETTPYSGMAPYDLPFNTSYMYSGLDGKLYTVPRYRASLNKYDPATNTLTTVLGTGTYGTSLCADDTPATSCAIDLDSFFISRNGRIYFIDNGVLRTIDDNNKVITLFGQYSSYGNNVAATAARFGGIADINLGKTSDVNKVIVEDSFSSTFREFSIDGNLTNLAPVYYSWHGPFGFEVDGSTGDILMPNGATIKKFDRATGTYSNVVGGGTYVYHDAASDGRTGAEINLVSGYSLTTLGLINNKLYYNKDYWTGTAHAGCVLKSYDIADSYRQAHVMGDASRTCSTNLTVGNNLNTSSIWAWNDLMKLKSFADPVDGQTKLFVARANTNVIYKSLNGGPIESFVTLLHNTSAFTYNTNASGLNLYYCASNGFLYKYNYNAGTTTQLTWNSPTIKCTGAKSILYHSGRNSLILVFSQNGLTGVGEYDLN